MSEKQDSIQPDLIERVDSLLEQIEETSKSYIPKEERGLDSGALISDDGTIPQPEPQITPEAEDTAEIDQAQDTSESAAESQNQIEDQLNDTVESEVETEADSESDPTAEIDSQPTDSIETAQQALDAIEEIEQQVEDLVGESIDGLLGSTEAAAEITSDLEADPPTNPTDELDTTANDELDLDIAEIEAALESSTIPESARADSRDDESEDSAKQVSTETVNTESPEQTSQTEDDDGLVDAIDALLESEPIEAQDEQADEIDDVDEVVDSLEESVQTESETEPDVAADADQDSSVDTATDTTSTAEIQETTEDTEQAESQAEIEVDEISIDEIEASLTVQKDSPSASSLDDSMDMLDSALAMAADDLLDGDFETEEGELVSGEAVASAIETALQEPEKSTEQKTADTDSEQINIEDAVGDLLDSTDVPVAADEEEEAVQEADSAADAEERAASDREPDTEPAAESGVEQAADAESEISDEASPETVTEAKSEAKSEPETETETESEPQTSEPDSAVIEEIEALEKIEAAQPISVPAWFERSIEVVRPWVDKYDPLKGKTMDAVSAVLGTVLVQIITHATPISAKALLIVSKPLSKQSPEIRNAVGYIALWTGFLAMVVWVYLLMFRAPHIPQPDTAPSRVIDVNEPIDPDPASVLPES